VVGYDNFGGLKERADVRDLSPLTLQETLRTIGNELETRAATQARLVVDAAGVAVDARGERDGYWRYDWADVRAASAIQVARRQPEQQPPPWMDPWALTRWSVLLRVTGLLLDAQNVRECVIEAAIGKRPEDVFLRVLVNGQEVFRRSAVGVELWNLRAQTRAAMAAKAPHQSQRRGFWRR
jgi:hypothetical protein